MPRPAWQGSTRRSTLPWGWYTRIRPRILARDREQCQWVREDTGEKCLDHANQVDHKNQARNWDHSDDNLWSLCEYHHQRKSSSEGGLAKAARARAAKRRHPGLLR
jgi:hypothetical protein